MKKNIKNWFKKEKTAPSEEASSPQEGYTSMSTNSLYSLPPAELVSIIFKYDLEVKNLNKELSSAKDSLSTMKIDLPKYQEQALLYKQHNETLQNECNKLASDLNEAQSVLDRTQASFDITQNQLSSKEELIYSYKAKIIELEKQVLELQITGINFDAGEEITKLKSKLAEASNSNAAINELKINNKMLENEVSKLSASISEGKEQIRM